MQIQLCEDDGLFHDGIPEIVILLVKFDDGKTKRIPYPADKTISALYQDLAAIAPMVQVSSAEALAFETVQDAPQVKNVVSGPLKPPSKPIPQAVDKSNIIEKEDIVTLVKLHERDTTYSGTVSPLVVGMDYRVIEIFGPFHPVTQKRIVQGYDVLDDSAPTPERMRVYPDEVDLKHKRTSEIVPVIHVTEEILPCPSCQAKNSLVLESDTFKGQCDHCGVEIGIARIVKDRKSVV